MQYLMPVLIFVVGPIVAVLIVAGGTFVGLVLNNALMLARWQP